MNPFWARSNVKPLNWLFAKNISFESKSKAKNGLRKLISSLQRLFGLGVWTVDTTTKDIFDENLVTHPSFFLKCFKTIIQILNLDKSEQTTISLLDVEISGENYFFVSACFHSKVFDKGDSGFTLLLFSIVLTEKW